MSERRQRWKKLPIKPGRFFGFGRLQWQLHISLFFFTFVWPCIVTNFFIMKPTKCANFPNLFWHETPHVPGGSSVHHQTFIHCIFGTGIYHTGLKTAFEQDQDGTAVPSWSCSKVVYRPVWHIPLPNIQWINSWWWAEELPGTCRVSCQNKFGKLAHLVGFIIKKIHISRIKPFKSQSLLWADPPYILTSRHSKFWKQPKCMCFI